MSDVFLFLYFAMINVIAFVMMGIDKRIAIVNAKPGNKRKGGTAHSRIPESMLMMLAVMLGACGIHMGMVVFRHKTKHMKFVIGVPVCLVLNLAAIYFLYKVTLIV